MSLISQREVGQRRRKRYKGVEGIWLVQGQGEGLGLGLEAKQAAVNPFYVSILRPVEGKSEYYNKCKYCILYTVS